MKKKQVKAKVKIVISHGERRVISDRRMKDSIKLDQITGILKSKMNARDLNNAVREIKAILDC